MLWELDAFHCNIKCRCIFVSGVFPPPVNQFNCFSLSLCARWWAKELEAKLTVNIQHTIGTYELENT